MSNLELAAAHRESNNAFGSIQIAEAADGHGLPVSRQALSKPQFSDRLASASSTLHPVDNEAA